MNEFLSSFEFGAENYGMALVLMLLGMVGIFVVMAIIMIAVYLLNKFAKDKPADQDDKTKK